MYSNMLWYCIGIRRLIAKSKVGSRKSRSLRGILPGIRIVQCVIGPFVSHRSIIRFYGPFSYQKTKSTLSAGGKKVQDSFQAAGTKIK